MRQLTETERLLIEKIVQLKRAARLEELQVARLLRKELECFALRWVLEPKKTLLFYSTQNNTDWNALRKNYFQVADFLYFIEELEQDRFVKIQTLSFEVKTDEERVLYDRGKYRYKSSDDTFWGIKGDMQYLVPVNAEHKVYIDFVSYLERYANKVIYPLPLLEDFVVNNYKSIEQRNFEKQIEENERHHQAQMKASADRHEKQIIKTNCSLVIAAIALITSATMPFLVNKCTPPTEINNAQLKTIEQAIINSKTTWPNAINIQSSDTLKIKKVSPTQK